MLYYHRHSQFRAITIPSSCVCMLQQGFYLLARAGVRVWRRSSCREPPRRAWPSWSSGLKKTKGRLSLVDRTSCTHQTNSHIWTLSSADAIFPFCVWTRALIHIVPRHFRLIYSLIRFLPIVLKRRLLMRNRMPCSFARSIVCPFLTSPDLVAFIAALYQPSRLGADSAPPSWEPASKFFESIMMEV